ncbi:hypothetical protein MKX01_017011 [Papaver californicum]|nr:hypothetical protein MKX01_017011 [Papaver californicum]
MFCFPKNIEVRNICMIYSQWFSQFRVYVKLNLGFVSLPLRVRVSLDSIICGTNFNPASESENVSLWRDYLRVLVHPVFNSPLKPEGVQKFFANLYSPCPQPEFAIGLPPHADRGLLTLLIQNDVGGMQIKNKGKWVDVNAISNSIMVNTSDHIQILSNGKYKGMLHRVLVNNKKTRISLVMTNGPPRKLMQLKEY